MVRPCRSRLAVATGNAMISLERVAVAHIAVAQPAGYAAADENLAQRERRLHWSKLLAAAFSIAVIGAMLSAVPQNWQAQPRDSFPLSYFPMFSAERADLHTEHYVAGWDAQGNRYVIPSSSIAPGGSIVRIRQATVMAMVRRGQSAQLCENVSRRIVARNEPSLSSVVRLEVVTGTFSLAEYLRGQKAPKTEMVRATCTIRR
jgi:hypothetical protein